MIKIDRTQASTRLILTLGETTTAPGEYVLHIQSSATGRDLAVPLVTNLSPYPQRYDEYVLDTQLFKDLAAGRCTYRVTSGDETVEVGVAFVTEAQEEFVFIEPTATDDDYVSI